MISKFGILKVAEGMEIKLPVLYKIKQQFQTKKIDNIEDEIANCFKHPKIKSKLKEGQNIAVAVGSRGIGQISEITRNVIKQLKNMGCEPFIVPAMGSHGNAEAEKQKEILYKYGICEETMGVSVKSSMEVIKLGTVKNEIPVYFDKIALNSDGIIIINRIKPHTDFTGEIESGLMKMLVIGLGKHKGCTSIHLRGPSFLGENILMAGELILKKAPILFGVAILENPYGYPYCIKTLISDEMKDEEKKLLLDVKKNMPMLPSKNIDVLVVEEMGKSISGTGMDTNIIGRVRNLGVPETFDPYINKIVVLNLADESDGNATGIGLADIVTKKLVNKIDFTSTYTNVLSGNVFEKAFIPIIANNEFEAISIGIQYSRGWDYRNVRLIKIKNTLSIEEIEVSETIWNEIKGKSNIELIKGPYTLKFDSDKELI